MNVSGIRKEIKELKNSILWKHEPIAKAFILGTEDSPTEAEIEAYREAHQRTHIVILYCRDCGKDTID